MKEFSSQIHKFTELLNSINENVKLGKTYTYNVRYCIIDNNDNNILKPTLQDTVFNYKNNIKKTMKTPEYDLLYRSRYSNNLSGLSDGYINIFNKSNQTIVMSDFLIFNKNYNIDFLDIDRLLPYCKIKVYSNEKYILDGWHYNSMEFYSDFGNRTIKFDMSEYQNMELIKTEEEKRLAVKALIMIMNEIPEEEINLHNYYTISAWYTYYNEKLSSYNNNLSNLQNNIEYNI